MVVALAKCWDSVVVIVKDVFAWVDSIFGVFRMCMDSRMVSGFNRDLFETEQTLYGRSYDYEWES